MVSRLSPLLLASGLLTGGCAAEPQPALLDTVCRSQFSSGGLPATVPACTTTGDVEITSGTSNDITGVRFGASGFGELRIRLNAINATTQNEWSLETLVASTRPEGSTLFRSLTWGSCGASCPIDPADVEAPTTEDFQWLRVIDTYAGSTFDPLTGMPVPDDAAVILRGADIDLIDISTPGFDGNPNQFF